MASAPKVSASRREIYEIRNGMGGLFDVSIIESLDGGRVKVRVHNPDFSGITFTPLATDLRPTGKPTRELPTAPTFNLIKADLPECF